jgi:proton-dependent oligopeptide transporter, POT family
MSLTKHPRSLRIFFLTEMWERYGFYVVQTLLALYLSLYFKWSDEKIYSLVGSFTALTYISPVLGGWIADHLIGQKRCTLLGALFLFLSYILFSFHASGHYLTLALSGIAVGTGLLKSTISSLLGNEYPIDSPLRESGFTIFYMGITSGIILGTTLPSLLNEHFGWAASFSSASIGLVFAFSIFMWGVKYLNIHDYQPYFFDFKKTILALMLIVIVAGLAFIILSFPTLANLAFMLTIVCSVAYLLYCAYRETKEQSRKTLSILFFCIISTVFWAFYFQMFLSFTLFITRIVNPSVLNFSFPAPYYVAIQSAGMIAFGIFISRQRAQPSAQAQCLSAANKFLLAIAMTTLSFGWLAYIAHLSLKISGTIAVYYMIPVYLSFSISELLLSPVGLSAITLLASRKRVSTMTGIFFVSLGIGGFFAGKLAHYTAITDPTLSLEPLKMHYASSYLLLFKICCIALCICCILKYCIRHLLKDE